MSSDAFPTFRSQLSQARQLSANALESYVQLGKASAQNALVAVMPADPRTEPALTDAYEFGTQDFDIEVFAQFESARGLTRVIGPASKGIVLGEGSLCLVGSFGARFDTIKRALGSRIGVMIDVGLAWDLSPAELVGRLLHSKEFDRVGLVLPFEPLRAPSLYAESLTRELPALFNSWASQVPIYMLSSDPAAAPLMGRYGVGVVHSTAAFLALMAAEKPTLGLKGPRIALISEMGSGEDFALQALKASSLQLAVPDPVTCQLLASELPRASRVCEALYIPSPTPRHLEIATHLLSQAPKIDGVWCTPTEGSEPLRIEMMQAAAVVADAQRRPSGPAFELEHALPDLHIALAARKLMRAWRLERNDLVSLFKLTSLRSEVAATLSQARHLAQIVGYPLGLWHNSELYPIADEAALDSTWESLREMLGTAAPAHLFDRYATTWQCTLVEMSGDLERLDYTLYPFPTLTWGGQTFPMPLPRVALDAFPSPLHAALKVLCTFASDYTELSKATFYVDAKGRFITGIAYLAEEMEVPRKRPLFGMPLETDGN